jgi:hypothetical protein
MAASSNKWKKDLLTEEDISKVLDKGVESDVFSEESDDFWFDTSEEDSDSRIQAVFCMKLNHMKKCQIFRNLLYLTAWRVQDLHFSV